MFNIIYIQFFNKYREEFSIFIRNLKSVDVFIQIFFEYLYNVPRYPIFIKRTYGLFYKVRVVGFFYIQ